MHVDDLPQQLLSRPTPFLAIDVAVLESNIAAAQTFVNQRGLQLRPHAKTHKVAEVAARQVAAGAQGLTVSSLGEAEHFAGRGFDDLFVAYSVPGTPEAAKRISRLLDRAQLRLAVDSIRGLESLQARGLLDSSGLQLVVEVNSGLNRSGVTPKQAAEIAVRASDAGFDVLGAFTYPGHGYAVGAATSAAIDEARVLRETEDAFASAGVAWSVGSGGSTPTLYATQPGDALTEIRPGVYALNDAQQVALGTASLSQVALFAVSTVISVPEPGRFVIDAGSKCIASDRPSFVDGHGLVVTTPVRTIERIWEHHAVVPQIARGGPDVRPQVGDRIIVVPNHVCTAINLQREVIAFDNGDTETWSVFAGQVNS